MTLTEHLGANIARLRKERGLSQTAVAVAMRERGHEWHQNTVSRIENGRQDLDFGAEVEDLQDIIGYFLTGTRFEQSAQRLGRTILSRAMTSRLEAAEAALAAATEALTLAARNVVEVRKIVEGQARRESNDG